jgi:hypothetical protein
MPLYEEKLINPLAVRFSQDRIWPDFQDGTSIEDSLAQITTVPLQDADYGLVLRPPFPPMEIIRLKQELREADGERTTDDKGQRLYGEESWFTFDNRRLYCLQRAALQFWPVVVSVVVKVLFDFPAVRCARHKFRTTSDGCSVKISLPDGTQGSLWTWEEAVTSSQASAEAVKSAIEAVRVDARKSEKEELDNPPSQALLNPGSRETTVAERFNSGNSQKKGGQVAGMQLLSLLQGSTEGANLQALFGGAPESSPAQLPLAHNTQWSEWQSQGDCSWQDEWQGGGSWQDEWQGYSSGKGHGNSQNRNRRRRKPKGGGKSEPSI